MVSVRPAVIPQGADLRASLVQITGAVEGAGAIAAQVIAIGAYGAVAVSAQIVSDNTILESSVAAIYAAALAKGAIPVNSVVVDRTCRRWRYRSRCRTSLLYFR